MDNVKELLPIFSDVLSFYNKATVFTSKDRPNRVFLRSYRTVVAVENTKRNTLRIYKAKKSDEYPNTKHGLYSQTTMRHIREFMQQQNYSVPEVLVPGLYRK